MESIHIILWISFFLILIHLSPEIKAQKKAGKRRRRGRGKKGTTAETAPANTIIFTSDANIDDDYAIGKKGGGGKKGGYGITTSSNQFEVITTDETLEDDYAGYGGYGKKGGKKKGGKKKKQNTALIIMDALQSKKKSSKKVGYVESICRASIVVANRDTGTLTILDPFTGAVLYDEIGIAYNSLSMEQPVPSNVLAGSNGLLYISDSTNDRIVVMDGETYDTIASIRVGDNPTKLSIDANADYLWVINEGDNTLMIIDTNSNVVTKTVPFSDDETIDSLLVDPNGQLAYVLTVEVEDPTVTYVSRVFADGRIFFDIIAGSTPSGIARSIRDGQLYVPTLDSNLLEKFPPGTIGLAEELQDDDVPLFITIGYPIQEPTGIVSSIDGSYLYITSDDDNTMYTFDVAGERLLPTVTTMVEPNPEQMVHTGNRLFITHRSPHDQVSVYETRYDDENQPYARYIRSIDFDDLDPGGITYYTPNSNLNAIRCGTSMLPTGTPFPSAQPTPAPTAEPTPPPTQPPTEEPTAARR